AALLLALWALFLLAALVMSWALNIDSRLKISGSENRILEAQAMAASGAEVAMAPTIKPTSPNLQGRFGPRQTYGVRITGEGGRLNINWLVAGENPARIEILRRYLEIKGIELNERDRMMERLLQLRAGPDGQDGTADDTVFKNMEEVRVALGLSPQQFQQLSPFISLKDPVLRVVSTGRSSDITRVIQLVFRRAGTTP